MAREDAVLVDRIRAHASKRRRVDVQRHGRVGAGVADAMNARGREVKRVAGRIRAVAGRTVDPQTLLAHPSADDRDRAGGDVVVVIAGVVIL